MTSKSAGARIICLDRHPSELRQHHFDDADDDEAVGYAREENG